MPIDTIAVDSTQQVIKKDQIKKPSSKKSALNHDIHYKAQGHIRRNMITNELLLYDKAKVIYDKSSIEAGQITINSKTKKIYVFGIPDSTGVFTQKPVLKDGEQTVYPDSAIINYETKKALIYNYNFKQDDFNVKSERAKKVTDEIYYLKNTSFTTSEYIEDPEYDFYVPKARLVPRKYFISGFANMRVYKVPTPLITPASYYSLNERGNSGIIIPTFGQNRERGFFIQNGGYYFAISDYADLKILGDWYSNKSFAINSNSNYTKRYSYKGSLSFNYESIITGNKDINDFTESTVYNLKWQHNQLDKANPTVDFSASVNLGSSNYYSQSLNIANTTSDNFLANSINSSISFTKRFRTIPASTLSINGTHTQNTQTKTVAVTFPSLNFNVDRFYPFRSKSSNTSNGFLQGINARYSFTASNSVSIGDSLFFKPEMYDAMQQSIVHTIPITTNAKILKYLNFNASTNFKDVWGIKQVQKSYVDNGSGTYEIKTDTLDKFGRFETYDFTSSLSTSIYGMFLFGEKKRLQAIRHTMQPTISYSFNPSFEKHYTTITNPSTGATTQYTQYELFGNTPSLNRSQSLGISLSNTFEGKFRTRDFLSETDSIRAEKKWKIKKRELFNIAASTSYNFEADSLKLNPINITSRLTLLTLPFNISMTLDPYKLDSNGKKINQFLGISGGLARVTALNISTSKSENLSLTISNKTFQKSFWEEKRKKFKEKATNTRKKLGIKKRKEKKESNLNESIVDSTGLNSAIDSAQVYSSIEDRDQIPNSEQSDVGIPVSADSLDKRAPLQPYTYKPTWSLSFSQNFSFKTNVDGVNTENSEKLKLDVGTIGIQGKAQLSPSLNVELSTGYDIVKKGLTFTTIKFYKDLLSWETYLTVQPIGNRKTWYFYIGIKSPVLKDIKYDKNKRSI